MNQRLVPSLSGKFSDIDFDSVTGGVWVVLRLK